MLLLALALVLTQEHVARGDLAKLSKFSEQAASGRLVVEVRGEGNLLSPRALRELQRWPGLVVLDLHLPVTAVEAKQLRRLKRFAARAPREDSSLKLLAPALVRKLPPRPRENGLSINCGHASIYSPEDSRATQDWIFLPDGIDDCALQVVTSQLLPQAAAPRE